MLCHHSGIRVSLTCLQTLVSGAMQTCTLKSWSHRGVSKLFSGRDLAFLLCLLSASCKGLCTHDLIFQGDCWKTSSVSTCRDPAHQEKADSPWFYQQGTGNYGLFSRTRLIYAADGHFDLLFTRRVLLSTSYAWL